MAFVWQSPAPAGYVAALDAMARRVPYLGRSTGVALVSAAVTDEGTTAALEGTSSDRPVEVYEPCDLVEAEESVRVPYPGFLEDLDQQFAADRPAWEVCRYRGYRRRRETGPTTSSPTDGPVSSVYRDVVALRFGGLKPQGRLCVRFTEALRSAVLRAAGDQAPSVLHGHGAPGRPHVAFLALPDVGHEHAEGHLLGLAVAVPDLEASQRSDVLRAVLGLRGADGAGVVDLRVPGIGEVELVYQPGLVRPWGAAPERWRQGSRRWASATPVILDRYPKRAGELEEAVLAGLRTVGLPEPVDLRVSAEPLLAGAARLRPMDLPAHAKGRIFRHVEVTFDRVVAGPVLVGAGRYLGVGLLAPVPMRGSVD